MGITETGEVNASPKFVIRDLKSIDVWNMTRVIGKIGVNKIRAAIPADMWQKTNYRPPMMMDESGEMVPLPRDRWTEAQIDAEMQAEMANDELAWLVLGMLIDNIGNCENEINRLLADGIGTSVTMIRDMDANEYMELIMAYVTREGFRDFFTQAWRLFQKASPSKSPSGIVMGALTSLSTLS